MAGDSHEASLPEGIISLLDTDLYKLTMQNAVLKYFPTTRVTYQFTNRTPNMKLNRAAHEWLEQQISRLSHVWISDDELQYLRETCSYLSEDYLRFLSSFRLRPQEQVFIDFKADIDTGSNDDLGDISLRTEGLWLETILYEVPLLALTSEAYFRFCDRNWTYDGQVEKARAKGLKLLQAGCSVSEFGSRRRRDYHTHELVIKGLLEAKNEAQEHGWSGKINGTSNVHMAKKFGITPIGTMAHEWMMGVAAITDDYLSATETALACWVGTFGKGVLSIALTDTFGTKAFLQGFGEAIKAPRRSSITNGSQAVSAPSSAPTDDQKRAASNGDDNSSLETERYADIFVGVRQDSGDPVQFVKEMRRFYDQQKIDAQKTIVFSDALDVEKCLHFKAVAEEHNFQPSFGVGTHLTNDFTSTVDGSKSKPMNIVIKLSSADGRPAVKISDNIGKNTGDEATVKKVKQTFGYEEQSWTEGDESKRW